MFSLPVTLIVADYYWSDGFFICYISTMKDPIVQSVIDKYQERSDVGIKKYGTTLQDNKLELLEWLNHIQEEMMDATLYVEKLKQELSK